MNYSLKIKLLELTQRALMVRADAQPDNGDKWRTTETGSKILLGKDGTVKGGMGGKFNGKNIKEVGGTKKFTKYQTNKEREQKNEPLKQHIGTEKFNNLHNGKAVKFYFNDPRTNKEVSATIKRDMVYDVPTYILSGNGAKRRVDEENIINMFERGEYRNEPTAKREPAKPVEVEKPAKKEKVISTKKQLENKIWGEVDKLTSNNDPDSHDYMTGRFLAVMANNGMKDFSHEESLMRHELDRTKGAEKTSKAHQRAIKILKETKEAHKKEHAKPTILAEHKQLNDAAGKYGYSITESGEISSSKGNTGITVSKKGNRLLYKDADNGLVFSTSPDENGIGAFLKNSYGAEAKQFPEPAKPI